jgi:hypothetical protein
MKAEQRIVVGGKMPRQNGPRDRTIEHSADPDPVEIGRRYSEAMIRRVYTSITTITQ